MSVDNIYNILKRFNGLTDQPQQQQPASRTLTEGKKESGMKCTNESDCACPKCKVNESTSMKCTNESDCTCSNCTTKEKTKKKGAIAEAVARVEASLIDKWRKVTEDEESKERSYVCVHAKKGKCDVKAKTSYEAAKKAAEKWKMKSTAGIDAHLADVTHDASSLGESEMDEDMLSSDQKKSTKRKEHSKTEGNEFSGELANARAQHKDSFEVDGKTYPVKEAAGMSRAAKGYEKYGKEGMMALAKAGREGKDLDKIRTKYDKYNEGVSEAEMTPKQKKFAKLAPPKDKITYADKIAGATKTNESFPTVSDAQKREDDRNGKTEKGTVTKTKSGKKHERDYDREETTSQRGRPVKDKFAKKDED